MIRIIFSVMCDTNRSPILCVGGCLLCLSIELHDALGCLGGEARGEHGAQRERPRRSGQAFVELSRQGQWQGTLKGLEVPKGIV